MIDRWFPPIDIWHCYSEYLTEYNSISSIKNLRSFNFYTWHYSFFKKYFIIFFFITVHLCYFKYLREIWYSICSLCLKCDKHFDQKFEQKLVYLYLFLSIFANLLQIQLVVVADRRVTNIFSRYDDALIFAFPRFSSHTLLPFYATLKVGWKRNLDKDGIFGGEENSIGRWKAQDL